APDAQAPDAQAPDAQAPDAQAPDAQASPARLAAEAAAEAMTEAALLSDVEALADDALMGRDNLSPGGEAARAWLSARLTGLGLIPSGVAGYEQPFEQGVNLVARLDGAVDEYVALVAHYDHVGASRASGCAPVGADVICNGAADNATGVAVLLAVASALRDLPRRRGVLFLFSDAEEDGLLGADFFARRAPMIPLERLVAAFNVDTVGCEMIPSVDAAFALGVELAPTLRAALDRSSDHLGYRIFPVSRFFDGTDQGQRSDAYPFWMARVPTIFYSSGVPLEYHTAADELEIIKPAQLLKIAQHLLLTSFDIITNEQIIPFDNSSSPHLGDAEALLYIAEAVESNPNAVGLESEMLPLLRVYISRLKGYLDDPPSSDREWMEYQEFIHTIFDLVFDLYGR
ncbi:M28 family peptidase, partial [Myxococcota bacterium]|nr:M28 family peptidase [Myxococcota bacterium]